jgi:hypothetical protein
MIEVREGRDAAQGQRTDKWEFRLLIGLAMAWFFVVSLLTRLLPRSLRPFAAPAERRESCFEEARRMAYAVIPYAFEW